MADQVTKIEKKEKKEKKERKFNSDRVSRNVKAALKATFPNEAIVVSSLVEKVEVLFPDTSKITVQEINTFKAVFCYFYRIKKEELAFAQYGKKAI